PEALPHARANGFDLPHRRWRRLLGSSERAKDPRLPFRMAGHPTRPRIRVGTKAENVAAALERGTVEPSCLDLTQDVQHTHVSSAANAIRGRMDRRMHGDVLAMQVLDCHPDQRVEIRALVDEGSPLAQAASFAWAAASRPG